MPALSSFGINRRNLNLLLGDQGGPYSLILLGQGANGGSIITDTSQRGAVPTVNQGVTTSTAQVFAGSSSLRFVAATPTWLAYGPEIFNPGPLDFTIEATIYVNAVGVLREIFDFRSGVGGGGTVVNCFVQNTAALVMRVGSGATLTQCASAGAVVTAGAFQHVAFCRQGGTLRIYRQGVQVASIAGPAVGASLNYQAIVNAGAVPRVGIDTLSLGNGFDGFMTNLRLTVGLCLYPGGTAFTPPAGLLTSPVL